MTRAFQCSVVLLLFSDLASLLPIANPTFEQIEDAIIFANESYIPESSSLNYVKYSKHAKALELFIDKEYRESDSEDQQTPYNIHLKASFTLVYKL